jgi:hypothetical protein
MRFRSLSLIGTAALLAAPLTTARAQYSIGNNSDVCGGSTFTFCISIASSQVGANFFITIMNEALHGLNAAPYDNISLTALGFDGANLAPIIFAASVGTVFTTSNNITDLSNFPGTWKGGVATPPPVKNGLLFQEFITFEFLNTSAATFGPSDLAIHAQAGPGGCSSKMEVNLSGGAHVNGADFISSGCAATTVTPEPATLAMFGTGLASMMGMGWRRRKRETDDSIAS